MLQPDVKAISVDDHIIEPPHLWQSRLPVKYRDIGPRVVEIEDGTERWVFEDQVVRLNRGNSRTLPGYDSDPFSVQRFSEMRPGCYDPKARLEDMDLDGVWAQVAFPDFSRFAGHRFIGCKDRTLANLCIGAYNDFVLDEWAYICPDRLIPVGLVALWDVHFSAAEVRRLAERGVRAIAFSENPTSLGLPSVYTDHWEPLWDAVGETGLAVCLHIGSSSKLIRSSEDAPACTQLSYVGSNSMIACTDWLFSGILERHPSIRVAFSEGGAGWVPYLLEQAEHVFAAYRDQQLVARRAPTELFAEHMYVCFIQDHHALASLGSIGEDTIMWESDYPHDSGLFPDSRRHLEIALREVPDHVAAKIAGGNARRAFGI
jgi:predicted TIM-barrel fold metal-dependent hydrolase